MPPRHEDELSEAIGKLYDGLRRRFDKGGGSSGGISMRQIGWVFSDFVLPYGLAQDCTESIQVSRESSCASASGQTKAHFHKKDCIGTCLGQLKAPLRRRLKKCGKFDIGFRGSADSDIIEESQMLTGDQNIIDVDFTVQWRIRNAGKISIQYS